MLIKPEIGFSYDCRPCEKPVTATADLFSLRGQRFVCRCTCGESALVAYIEAGRLRVEYPCPVCGQRHRETLPLADVCRDAPAALCCAITGLPACYVGRADAVAQMDAAASEEALAAIVEHLLGVQKAPPVTGTPPDPADVLSAAREVALRDGISCRCGSLRFSAAYDEGFLRISCAKCGKSRAIPMNCAEALANFRNCGMLLL